MLLFVIAKYLIALIITTILLIAQTDATLLGLTATCSAGVTAAGKTILGSTITGGGLLAGAIGLGVGALGLAAKFLGPRPSKKPAGRAYYLYFPRTYPYGIYPYGISPYGIYPSGIGCPCYPGYSGSNCWCGGNNYGATPYYYYNPYLSSCNNYQSYNYNYYSYH